MRFDHPDATFWSDLGGYTVKKLFDISVPSRDVTYQTLPFLPRERLVSEIPAGDANVEKLFLRCTSAKPTKDSYFIVMK